MTHCLRNSFHISLPDFLRISLTISHMKVLITSQSDQSILQFRQSILTIQLLLDTFKLFFCFDLCSPKNTADNWQAHDIKKGRRTRTTDDPEESLEALSFLKFCGVRQQLQIVTALRICPRPEQLEQLELIVRTLSGTPEVVKSRHFRQSELT